VVPRPGGVRPGVRRSGTTLHLRRGERRVRTYRTGARRTRRRKGRPGCAAQRLERRARSRPLRVYETRSRARGVAHARGTEPARGDGGSGRGRGPRVPPGVRREGRPGTTRTRPVDRTGGAGRPGGRTGLLAATLGRACQRRGRGAVHGRDGGRHGVRQLLVRNHRNPQAAGDAPRPDHRDDPHRGGGGRPRRAASSTRSEPASWGGRTSP